jgi:WD40 repeat protein/tRNA A-37 threonylcarbamoyl transferase component Bud32
MTDPSEGKTEIHQAAPADDSAQTIQREPSASVVGDMGAIEVTAVDAAVARPARRTSTASVPDRIGEYEVLEELARGGMGIVFKARHQKLQRVVALKMILHGQLAGEDNLQRFHLEATATAQLQHPGIVSIYEVDTHDGQPFFTMEYIDGISLSQAVQTGPLRGHVAARYLEQTARAVHFAHTRGILHRDLKPANVLIDEHDQPKITDFGLAKVLQSDSKQTKSGAIMGTPSYMAPEQALAIKHVTPAVDVYSLGAILYELVTGRPPFQGETAMATMTMVIEQEPVPPRLLNPQLDADLETICLKCLEKEPSRRYLSAELLANDLRNYLEGKPINARRVSMLGRVVKWCRRKPASAALVAVTAVALTAIVTGGVAFGIVQHNLAEKAETEAEHARAAEKQALAAEQKASAQNKAFRYLLYVAQYRLARVAWESADARRALEWLNRWQHTGKDREDPRGWEWYYLHGLCDGKRALRVPGGKVTTIAFRPDGAWLATADDGGNVQLWDIATGKVVRTLKIHDYNIAALAFHPNGRWLAAAGEKAGNPGAVRVYDTETGNEVYSLKEHTKAVRALAFSSDGRWLATGGDDRVVRVWDAKSGAPAKSWELIEGSIRLLAFDPKSARLAAGAGSLVRVFHVADKDPPTSLRHDRLVTALAFAKDNEVITVSGDRSDRSEETVHVWSAAGERPARTFALPGRPWVALSPDGTNVATCTPNLNVGIWSVGSEKLLATSPWHMQPVQMMAFSPDGSRLACAGVDGTVRLGDRFGGQEAIGLGDLIAHPVRALAYHPQGKELAAGGEDGLHFFAPSGGLKRSLNVLNPAGLPTSVTTLTYSPDGATLALAARDKSVRIFDPEKSTQLKVLLGHTGVVRALAYSADGRLLASAGDDKIIRLWNVQTGEKIAELSGHASGITALAFSKRNELASVDTGDEGIHIWDINTRKERGVLKGHENGVVALAFSPSGSRLASGSFDKTIRIWDMQDMKETAQLEGHTKVVNAVVFTPDSTRLISGSADATARVWDVVTRQELLKLEAGSEVGRIALATRDGSRLACLGHDRIIRIWEAELPKKK